MISEWRTAVNRAAETRADYVRAVQPQQVVHIHQALLSDIGPQLAGSLPGENGPSASR